MALGERTRSKELASDYTVVERRLYTVDESTIGTLYDRVSEIALGLTPEPYTTEEREAAFSIRTAAKRVDRNEIVLVLAERHEMLASAADVVRQIGEIAERLKHERALSKGQQREPQAERSFGIDR